MLLRLWLLGVLIALAFIAAPASSPPAIMPTIGPPVPAVTSVPLLKRVYVPMVLR